MGESLKELADEAREETGRPQLAAGAMAATEATPASEQLRRLEALVDGQSQVLEKISQGLPLSAILEAIVRWVEAQSHDEVLASLLLLDREGQRLQHGAAPSLPKAYNDAVHGIHIGPAVGSCGTAAFTRRPVIVEDIAHDPLWADVREIALAHDLRACWSTPLIAATGQVLGTFAMYYRQPRRPTSDDLQVIHLVTRIAILAIEHKQAEEEKEQLRLREQQAQFQAQRQRLRLQRERLQVALAASGAGTFRWNPHTGEFLDFDENLKRLLGMAPDEPMEVIADFVARVHPDDVAALLVAIERCQQGADLEMEYRVILPDGGTRWLYVRAKMPGDAESHPIYLDGACMDITARRRAEEAVRESEEKFRTLADNISQLTWMAYADGHIFWYNRRWYEYTGTKPESREDWDWRCPHAPDMLPEVTERWKHSIATGEPFEMVFPLKGADGTFRPFLTRVMPVKDERGQVVRWFGTSTDIAEQVRLQEAMRASERALQEANQRKDEFLSIASHELRTPLTSTKMSIQGIARHLERWLREPALDAAVPVAQRQLLRALLGHSERSLSRLEGLVRDLLDVSRIQAGKLEMRPERMDLVGIVREVVEEVTEAWPGREVRFQGRLRAAEGHASTAEDSQGPVWIWADPERIRQVVINYLSNALKYAPAEQPVDVFLEDPTEELDRDAGQRPRQHGSRTPMTRVSVRDLGPGLTPEQQAKLFERFSQVDGIVHRQGSGLGLGLGLYISRTIIERHDGQVGVRSVAGEGSTFWFTLPRAHTVPAEAEC